MRPVVFISSTFKDLAAHRQAVKNTLLRVGAEPVFQEELGAAADDPIQSALHSIERSHACIFLLGVRYGYVPEGQERSVTEIEYDTAGKLEKPRLVYVMADEHPIPAGAIEMGPGAMKMQIFRQRVLEQQLVYRFRSVEDLATRVGLDIARLIQPTQAAEEAQPVLPQPLIVHPRAVQGEFLGRSHEMRKLEAWIRDPDSAAVLAIVGVGGIGKSALAWHWFQQLPSDAFAGSIWWSLFEDSSYDSFVRTALSYVSGLAANDLLGMSLQHCHSRLVHELTDRQFLLILDGIEASFDSEQERRPPGEPAMRSTRSISDAHLADLFTTLARHKATKLLITGRVLPEELETDMGRPVPGCDVIRLGELSNEEAASLWAQSGGMALKRDQERALLGSLGNHPLAIELAAQAARSADLSESLANYEASWSSGPLPQSLSQYLGLKLQQLSNGERALLAAISAAREPVTFERLARALCGEGRPFESSRQLDLSLARLEDRGLITWNRERNNFVVVHAIVRASLLASVGDEERLALAKVERDLGEVH